MTKRVLFQIHWFLGITAGVVLAVMGVTGALLSYEDAIMEALSPRLYAPGAPDSPDLSPDRLIAKVQRTHPGYHVSRIEWETARDRTHEVRLAAMKGKTRKDGRVDRATGEWLGAPAGVGVFGTIETIHRWLALPGEGDGAGRQITGFAALSLVFFAVSGLYLRWPRRVLNWRSWLALDWRKTGPNLWRALHATIGTWVLLFYLLSAMTGLWWSYDWYRRGAMYVLTGEAEPRDEDAPGQKGGTAPPVALDPVWRDFLGRTGDRYAWVAFKVPKPGAPLRAITLEARARNARHLRQWDRFRYDLPSGHFRKQDLYADRPIGIVLSQSMVEVHRGAFFGVPGQIFVLIASLTMPLFTVTGFLLYFARRKRKRALAVTKGAAPLALDGDGRFLVIHASQTGTAERHAREAAQALAQGGTVAKVLPLSALTPAMLAAADTALVVASTYGEGEPPDTTRGFVRRVMAAPLDLPHLSYGVLALGDREYPDFCAFGIQLGAWLSASGAHALFPVVQMDREDAQAEQRWRDALARMGAADFAPVDHLPAFAPWTLVERTALNPESPHQTAFHLRLQPPAGSTLDWEAGDIVEVQPGADSAASSGTPPPPLREYSAASIPGDGTLDVVVRQVRHADGGLGIGSGWLTAHMDVGQTTPLRLRANPGFRIDDASRRLILIGNGTGIAGLRAHLRACAAQHRKGHWLLFGERHRGHEAFFDSELQAWLMDGTLARLDRSFSRDADCGRYVQHLLEAAHADLRRWVGEGATILVCGSLDGMAHAVHTALSAILGEGQLDIMAETGVYKRDVY